MRELIVSEMVTLDGVMEAPAPQQRDRPAPGAVAEWVREGQPLHAHSGWVLDFPTPELGPYNRDKLLDAGALLLGRATYEVFAEAWPNRSDEIADKYNSMPKHVISTTLGEVTWHNTAVIRADVASQIAELKQQGGGYILVVGSRTVVHTLIQHGLVDQYRLTVFPVVLGSGRRLFPEMSRRNALKLVDAQTFSSGVMELTYHCLS